MPDNNAPERYVSLAQVAELLDLTVDEVLSLIHEGLLRGARVGSPAQWRVAEASVSDYLDEQREESRRIALWNQSVNASFPELWGGTEGRRPR
ncbi:helix-turn-helix domain-containing protein [Microbacterium sp. NC79]|uniref:helix-turn-helix domain-containing protein n=1 Tax=Microbacterium sp. NC79 TaxID=2851009 RepID=UPI001C2BE113|nr:helix-turn-helix domain-containing protein [Microbacterium sp. NC79]MBV0894363.1 helix-turn-helix domain-containing protein [Microbacterium sp. NC79]